MSNGIRKHAIAENALKYRSAAASQAAHDLLAESYRDQRRKAAGRRPLFGIELEHSENVHTGLYARLASSSSMAETRRGSSAVTSGANRATTSPLRLSRNFSKFHSTSAEFSEFTP